MFKRFFQLGMNSKFSMVTWRGDRNQVPRVEATPNYWGMVVNAFITAEHLAAHVGRLRGPKTVAAHSLGNMVVSSAIDDYAMNVERYLMVNAAVPIEAYDKAAPVRAEMLNPEWRDFNDAKYNHVLAAYWHDLFESSDARRALTWRGRFDGIGRKVVNYYSPDDSVLMNSDGRWSFRSEDFSWAQSELSKGRADSFPGFSLGSMFKGGGYLTPHTMLMTVFYCR